MGFIFQLSLLLSTYYIYTLVPSNICIYDNKSVFWLQQIVCLYFFQLFHHENRTIWVTDSKFTFQSHRTLAFVSLLPCLGRRMRGHAPSHRHESDGGGHNPPPPAPSPQLQARPRIHPQIYLGIRKHRNFWNGMKNLTHSINSILIRMDAALILAGLRSWTEDPLWYSIILSSATNAIFHVSPRFCTVR